MKKLLSLFTAIVLSASMHAQPGADSRLIASVTYEYQTQDSTFIATDSTRLTYTGNNGWDYITNDWKYDSSRFWKFKLFSNGWDENKRWVQQVVNDRIVSRVLRESWGGGWLDEDKTDYTYTNGVVVKKQVDKMGNGTFVPYGREVNTYDARGLQTESLYQETWGNPYWTNIERTINSYNLARQNDTSRYQKWVFSDKKWIDQHRYIFIYSGGFLFEMVRQVADTGGWRNNYRTIYGYLNGKCVAAGYEQWDAGTNDWRKESKTEYNYNAAGDMIEERYSSWIGNKYGAGFRFIRTYNEFHRMVAQETQSWHWTDNKWHGSRLVRNYYEAYTNDVKNVTSNIVQLSVYPVPAKDQITIAASFKQAQPVTITVRYMNGRIVKQLADQAGAQFRKSINVADMPAGNYIIHVSGITEVATKTISIAH